jgi:hypothetical protein
MEAIVARERALQADARQDAASRLAMVARNQMGPLPSLGASEVRRSARDLTLDKLPSHTPIISNLRITDAVWCRPEALSHVTRKGELRHARFKGLAE